MRSGADGADSAQASRGRPRGACRCREGGRLGAALAAVCLGRLGYGGRDRLLDRHQAGPHRAGRSSLFLGRCRGPAGNRRGRGSGFGWTEDPSKPLGRRLEPHSSSGRPRAQNYVAHSLEQWIAQQRMTAARGEVPSPSDGELERPKGRSVRPERESYTTGEGPGSNLVSGVFNDDRSCS